MFALLNKLFFAPVMIFCPSLNLCPDQVSASSSYYFLTINDTIECVSVSKTARMGFAGGSVLSVCVNILREVTSFV